MANEHLVQKVNLENAIWILVFLASVNLVVSAYCPFWFWLISMDSIRISSSTTDEFSMEGSIKKIPLTAAAEAYKQ